MVCFCLFSPHLFPPPILPPHYRTYLTQVPFHDHIHSPLMTSHRYPASFCSLFHHHINLIHSNHLQQLRLKFTNVILPSNHPSLALLIISTVSLHANSPNNNRHTTLRSPKSVTTAPFAPPQSSPSKPPSKAQHRQHWITVKTSSMKPLNSSALTSYSVHSLHKVQLIYC